MTKRLADLPDNELFETFLLLEELTAYGVYGDCDLQTGIRHECIARRLLNIVEDTILTRHDLEDTDGLSTVITAAHMGPSEAIKWAGEHPEQMLEAMKTGDCPAMHIVGCTCGKHQDQ